MELVIPADGDRGHGRESDRDMDSVESQTDANGDQYIFSEFSHRGYHGVHAKRDVQFRVHVDRGLGVR